MKNSAVRWNELLEYHFDSLWAVVVGYEGGLLVQSLHYSDPPALKRLWCFFDVASHLPEMQRMEWLLLSSSFPGLYPGGSCHCPELYYVCLVFMVCKTHIIVVFEEPAELYFALRFSCWESLSWRSCIFTYGEGGRDLLTRTHPFAIGLKYHAMDL